MRNIEFKARLLDRDRARDVCREVGAAPVAVLEQRDTYFEVPSGRLKRRETRGELTQWVEYHRPDTVDAVASDYELLNAREAAERFDLTTLRQWVVVDKVRELYRVGEIRIHLDRVRGLGDFLEFEALVNKAQPQAQAESALSALRAQFKPVLGSAYRESYSDLCSRLTRASKA